MSEAEARAVLVPAAYQVAGGASAWIGALNARIDDYRDAVLREAAAKIRDNDHPEMEYGLYELGVTDPTRPTLLTRM